MNEKTRTWLQDTGNIITNVLADFGGAKVNGGESFSHYGAQAGIFDLTVPIPRQYWQSIKESLEVRADYFTIVVEAQSIMVIPNLWPVQSHPTDLPCEVGELSPALPYSNTLPKR